MIQEKDFLYRVPVKTAPITTPGGQIRNPEILVDVEGGEFMHGNILDANSTNKLINQSVKDAVDNKLIESGLVTQDLLDAETSARTKGDEDLGAKIKAEQTRAEGKEKEISDKLAIVDGDSNTEGSFRKAIADVIAAAPEDLDTLKEIADKLADNDDLHTALNQAITDKADASALLNEVTRATGAESALQAAIDTKADATTLSNYVLTAALNKQIDTLNTAISAKQDAGNYIPYNSKLTDSYQINKALQILIDNKSAQFGPNSCINIQYDNTKVVDINYSGINLKLNSLSFTLQPDMIKQVGSNYNFNVNAFDGVKFSKGPSFVKITPLGLFSNPDDDAVTQCNTNDFIYIKSQGNNIVRVQPTSIYCKNDTSNIAIDSTSISLTDDGNTIMLGSSGIVFPNGDNNHVLTSNGSTIDISKYATLDNLDMELNNKAETEDLTELEQKVTANTTALEGKQDKGNYIEYSSKDNDGYTIDCKLNTFKPITVSQTDINVSSQLASSSLIIIRGSASRTKYTVDGIISNQHNDCLATSDGTFKPISDFVLKEDAEEEYATPDQINDIKVGLTKKQDKIKVNRVDVTNLTHANIDQLINIVQELLIALDSSGLIIMEDSLE